MGPMNKRLPPCPAGNDTALTGVVVRLIKPREVGRWNRLMVQHHYLGNAQLVGETLRYVAERQGRWLALLGWGSAAYHLRVRERHIGWSTAQRRSRLPLVACNARFLILPGIDLPNLASQVLGACTRRLSQDWQVVHGHGVLLAETFVDPQRFQGTCYRAAGWLRLGASRGFAPYALTCLAEYFLSLQEQLCLRLAPARRFGQSIGDLCPVLEHLFEGKPRSYGLEYLAKGKSKFPPAARVPRLPASSIPRGKVRAPGPEPCRSITPRIACRRARLWRFPGPAWAGDRVALSA
jgi:hypothetical protein